MLRSHHKPSGAMEAPEARTGGERTFSMAAIPLEREIKYPERDGRPMGETQFHIDEIMYLVLALGEHFRHTADAFVAGDLFFYYEKGNRQAVVAPDVFV